MSDGDGYFENVALVRRELVKELGAETALPEFLRPEAQEVTDAIRERSEATRRSVGDWRGPRPVEASDVPAD